MSPTGGRVLWIYANEGERESVRSLLASALARNVEVACVGARADAVDALDGGAWDLALVDLVPERPLDETREVLRTLRRLAPQLPIVVVASEGDRSAEVVAVEVAAACVDRTALGAGALGLAVRHARAAAELELARAELSRERAARERDAERVRLIEERFQVVIHATSDAVWDHDLDADTVWWSEGMTKLFGYSPERIEARASWWVERIHPDDRAAVVDAYAQTRESGRSDWRCEYRFARADGDYACVLDRGWLARDRSGRARRAIGAMVDLTELRRAEQQRRTQEERLSRLNEFLLRLMSREAEFYLDLDGAVRTFTEVAAEAIGVERASVWLFEEGRDAIRAVDLFERGPARHSRDSRLDAASYPAYFAALQAGHPIAAGDARSDPRTCEFAESYLATEGITSMLDAAVFLRGLVAGVVCLEHVGAPREWTLEEQNFVAFVAGLLAVVLEVAERARAEERLRASEERFRQLADAMPQIVWAAQPDGTIDYYNDKWYAFAGVARDGSRVPTLRDYLHPDDLERREAAFARAMASGTEYELEYRLLDRATGRYRWFLGRALPARDEAGEVVRWFGTSTDIDRLKRIEESLRAEEQRLARAQGVVHFGSWEFDVASGSIGWSDEVYRIFACDPSEFRPSYDTTMALVHPEDRSGVATAFAAAVERGGAYELEHRILVGHGREVRFLKECGEVQRNASGAPVRVVGSVFDVTPQRVSEAALRASQERLRQAQKMEAIGQLAGGVAHDFNNLLTIVNGYCDMLLLKLKGSDTAREMVAEIRHAGERAASLTRQLLAFSRKTVLEPKVLDLNDVVREIERMLRRLIGEDIVLTTILDPGASRVRVDPGQIEQVILNLAVNARDAMPRGGRVTIETRDAHLDEEYCRERADAVPGRYVLLSVSDTGIGMTPEVLPRVFEPFFTTKEAGRGTGLGLSTVYGIVKQSGGHVSVYSEPGVGTSFKVYLPALEADGSARSVDRATATAAGGRETILLAEDEPKVRAIARITLESYGYTVLESGDGREALAAADRHPEPIHLLITDVVMPGMSGRELADALRARRDGLKVLYVSGYTDDAIVHHGILHAEVAFLQKPFSPASLAAKVRDVLDGRG